MPISIRRAPFVAAATALAATLMPLAMPVAAHAQKALSPEVAVTYDLERAKKTDTNCGCFWLNGAALEGGITFFKGLGVTAELSGTTASNIASGVGVSKIAFLAGPRYSRALPGPLAKRGLVFLDVRLGGAHGFNSIFPTTGGSTGNGLSPTANSFAFEAGGGLDIKLAKGFSARLPEVDYVYTQFPDNGSNTQSDLRLAFGVSYRFGKK